MKKQNSVIVAMSGGVDSSAAALLLQNNGYHVIGATMETGYGSAVADARNVCEQLGIEHHVIDIRDEFQRKVIDPFVAAYASGLTPNPCIDCNHSIKFPVFLPMLASLDADFIATGHYVRKKEINGRFVLTKAADESKDQSYFLYRLSQEILSKTLFPLGDLTKPEIREIAKEHGLVSAEKKDSYDICFIPDGDYRALLEQKHSDVLIPGDIVDLNGTVLGQHHGLPFYTLGQRKGLNVSYSEPVYVLRADREKNQLIVGPKDQLMTSKAVIYDCNYLAIPELTDPMEVYVRVRYKSALAKATIRPLSKSETEIAFQEPQWGIAPGQSAVFYLDDYVFGGGKFKQV